MAASVDFFDVGGSGPSPANNTFADDDSDTDDLVQDFETHVGVTQSTDTLGDNDSDFFQPTTQPVASRNSGATITKSSPPVASSQLDALLSQLGDNGDGNYFKVAASQGDGEDDDDDSLILTPTTTEIMAHRPKNSSKTADFFDLDDTPRSDITTPMAANKADSPQISRESSPTSNYFKPDDIDATSRSVSSELPSEIPEMTERSGRVSEAVNTGRSQVTENNGVSPGEFETARSLVSERSMMTDVEFTERSLEIDASSPEGNKYGLSKPEVRKSQVADVMSSKTPIESYFDQKSDILSDDGGWSTVDTPTSNYFKPNDKASDLTDFEVTERSDVTLSPDSDVMHSIKDTKQNATFTAFRNNPNTNSFGATYDKSTSDIESTTERSDLTPTPDSAMYGMSESPTDSRFESPMFGQSQSNNAIPKPKSKTAHASDIARKYEAAQKQRANKTKDGVKSDFVNMMLTRAAREQERSASSSSNERPTSAAGKYPRGIQLSKTYTKNGPPSTAKTFKAWSAQKKNNGNIQTTNQNDAFFQNGAGAGDIQDGGVVVTSPPVMTSPITSPFSTSQGGRGDAPSSDWKTHRPFGLDLDSSGRSDGTFSSLSTAAGKSPAVIGDAYYQSILQTTPLSNPATPNTTDRSAPSRMGNSAAAKNRRPPSATKNRPSSAPKSRPSSAGSIKTQTNVDKDNNGGFTVVGKKQDVGPKRPKSTYGRYRSEHKPSYVDELLFGKPAEEPDFPSPFGDTSNTNPKPLPFVAIASMEPPAPQNKQNGNAKNPSARSNKSNSSATRTSAGVSRNSNVKARGKQNFNQSYVDEGLFGPRPDEPSFKAPWDKSEKRKPFVFDGTSYKPHHSAAQRREQAAAASKKPVWR